MRANRNRTEQQETTVDETTTEQTAEQATEAAPAEQATTTEGAKRAPRNPIDVGEVLVTKSTRTNFSTRSAPIESNPVFLAVKSAAAERQERIDAGADAATAESDAVDLHVDADKVEGVKNILRRSGQKDKLNVGVNIASAPYPVSDQGEGKVVLTFKVGERQVRPGKASADTTADSETVTE